MAPRVVPLALVLGAVLQAATAAPLGGTGSAKAQRGGPLAHAASAVDKHDGREAAEEAQGPSLMRREAQGLQAPPASVLQEVHQHKVRCTTGAGCPFDTSPQTVVMQPGQEVVQTVAQPPYVEQPQVMAQPPQAVAQQQVVTVQADAQPQVVQVADAQPQVVQVQQQPAVTQAVRVVEVQADGNFQPAPPTTTIIVDPLPTDPPLVVQAQRADDTGSGGPASTTKAPTSAPTAAPTPVPTAAPTEATFSSSTTSASTTSAPLGVQGAGKGLDDGKVTDAQAQIADSIIHKAAQEGMDEDNKEQVEKLENELQNKISASEKKTTPAPQVGGNGTGMMIGVGIIFIVGIGAVGYGVFSAEASAAIPPGGAPEGTAARAAADPDTDDAAPAGPPAETSAQPLSV